MQELFRTFGPEQSAVSTLGLQGMTAVAQLWCPLISVSGTYLSSGDAGLGEVAMGDSVGAPAKGLPIRCAYPIRFIFAVHACASAVWHPFSHGLELGLYQ